MLGHGEGHADLGGQIAVAGGIHEDLRLDRPASVLVLDEDRRDAAIAGVGGAVAGMEKGLDAVLEDQFVQLNLQLFCVEHVGRARAVGAMVDGSAFSQPPNHLFGQPADDPSLVLGVVGGVPDIDETTGGHAAEGILAFDQSDARPPPGRAHGGEDTGATAAQHAHIHLGYHRHIAGWFADHIGHAREPRYIEPKLWHKLRC